jgi:hypothetical protein
VGGWSGGAVAHEDGGAGVAAGGGGGGGGGRGGEGGIRWDWVGLGVGAGPSIMTDWPWLELIGGDNSPQG